MPRLVSKSSGGAPYAGLAFLALLQSSGALQIARLKECEGDGEKWVSTRRAIDLASWSG
jgi:hypothetical protein